MMMVVMMNMLMVMMMMIMMFMMITPGGNLSWSWRVGIWHSQIPTINIDNDEYHDEGEGSDQASGTTLDKSSPVWVGLWESQMQIWVKYPKFKWMQMNLCFKIISEIAKATTISIFERFTKSIVWIASSFCLFPFCCAFSYMCHQATWTRWCMITLIAFRWHSRICVPSNVINQYLFISKCIPVRLALIIDVFLNWAYFSAGRRGMCMVWRYQLNTSW